MQTVDVVKWQPGFSNEHRQVLMSFSGFVMRWYNKMSLLQKQVHLLYDTGLKI